MLSDYAGDSALKLEDSNSHYRLRTGSLAMQYPGESCKTVLPFRTCTKMYKYRNVLAQKCTCTITQIYVYRN